MHISDDFVESIFVAIYGVFETRRERAAVTLFLSVLLERNTLPLTGAWGGWVVGGLAGGWLAGCWLLGMDHWFRYIHMYIYIYYIHLGFICLVALYEQPFVSSTRARQGIVPSGQGALTGAPELWATL